MEYYVNKIILAAHNLNAIKLEVSDEWIGTLLLTGLLEQYKPMIMAIENSGLTITADSIKTKLLQEIQQNESASDNVAFFGNKSKR